MCENESWIDKVSVNMFKEINAIIEALWISDVHGYRMTVRSDLNPNQPQRKPALTIPASRWKSLSPAVFVTDIHFVG